MSNPDSAFGFKALRMGTGGEAIRNAYAPRGYTILSTYGTALYRGMPVALGGTGLLGRPDIITCDVNTYTIGIFDGVEYTDSNGVRQYRKSWVASTVGTDIIAYVYDHEDTIFAIQNDGDGVSGGSNGTVAVTAFGNKADWTPTTSSAGSHVTGLSSIELDTSNIGTGDALQILGLAGDTTLGDWAIFEVIIREHAKRGNGGNSPLPTTF